MFKVLAGDGECFGFVDTRKQAEGILAMKKLGRNGLPITNTGMVTKASGMNFEIKEVPDSSHPGYKK